MNSQQADTGKECILVIDNNPDDLHVISNTLTEHGYEVFSAINSAIALIRASVVKPDLILLDIEMSDTDGYQVCQQLKSDRQTRDIPVIFLSIFNQAVDKVKAFTVGGVDYITKPFQVEEVLARVRHQLTIRSLQKRLIEQNNLLQQENIARQQANQCLKNLEAKLHSSLEKEKELSQFRANFLSLIAHEFRTPLTIICSADEILEKYGKKFSEEKRRNYHQRIQNAVVQLTEMLDEALIICQVKEQKLLFEPKPLNLINFCRDLVETLQISTNRHQLIFTGGGDLSNVSMDEKLLGYILTNLLSNAIKYSPQGGTIQLDLTASSKSVIVRIRDSGIGIYPADLPNLFESFGRGSNVGDIKGTGLGLAIVKKSVDLHGGEISVDSELGVGTTFTVTLPLPMDN
ncbi:MAG: hybrid sensor histidine kinase/response regulator [Coleofasciculaceae cyanobacterium]